MNLQRRPAAEIPLLLNRRVIEQHADEAAFLWQLRQVALRAPHYRLRHLAMLDERLAAHLQGLGVATRHGQRAAARLLADGDAGALFALACLAFVQRDETAARHALAITEAAPKYTDALCQAWAWLDPDVAAGACSAWAGQGDLGHLARLAATAGIEAAAPELDAATCDDDPWVRAMALRTVGETRRYDLSHRLSAAANDPDVGCRFHAAAASALWGDTGAADTALDIATDHPSLWSAAAEVPWRCADLVRARDRIRALAVDATTLRAAMLAAAALGDPAVVGWLIQHMGDETHARVAAEAVTVITGIDLAEHGLVCQRPDGAEDPDGDQADDDLPWPDAEGLARWWHDGARRAFTFGSRYLSGEPVSQQALAGVLRDGSQRLRRFAAVELSRLIPTGVIFPVYARADLQRRRLARCA